MEKEQVVSSEMIPLLPLRDVVVYPHMVIPLFVGREKSINALNSAMEANKKIFLVAQKNASDDDPIKEDLFEIGTLATILQLLKLPDGTVKVLVEGERRGRVLSIQDEIDYLTSEVDLLSAGQLEEKEEEVLLRTILSAFERYVQLSKKVPSEVITSLRTITEPGRLADTIAAHMSLKISEKQGVLELVDLRDRMEHLMTLMESEMDLMQVEKRIRGRVKKQMEKSQREYYLNEQMKAIQKELGDIDGEGGNETDDLKRKVDASGMSKDAKEKADAELSKLRMMSPMSAEASVVRTYVEWLTNLPWKKKSKLKHDLEIAQRILDEDHYGLEEVKERILEYLAVQSRVRKIKGPILCLVGPPGVGKTSLGQSLARATNRKFVRMALGGVRDESEIRGHRRTYIGSMPGKILQKMSKATVRNPLFLLDEIDKMGMDHRGDPASALLEVLDPEQNNTFSDHYLEVDYDLSDVMFICTSNSMNIPGPLLDRMEVIRLPGYTEDEKLNIAIQHLMPKAMKENGLKNDELELTDGAITDLIRYYTREAGVRNLSRELTKVCRKVVKIQVSSKEKVHEKMIVNSDNLEEFSGVQKFQYGVAEEENQIGQVTGLAWTSVGGELLTLECSAVTGKGRVTRTGKLGDVMQESIQAATTVVKSRAQSLGIYPNFMDKHDLHIHVPEGATPKDGPSAGIGMVTALVSALTQIAVRADVAMTGEITLRGQVLPIGGLKEKLLAAHRGGIKTVIIPSENERDLKEIPDNVKKDIKIVPVKWIDQVLDIALVEQPISLTDEQIESQLQQEREAGEKIQNRMNTH